MGISSLKYVNAFGYQRVQGTTDEVSISAELTMLHRLVVADDDSGGTVTIRNEVGDVLQVLNIPSGSAPLALEYNLIAEGLSVQPSAATLDILVMYA